MRRREFLKAGAAAAALGALPGTMRAARSGAAPGRDVPNVVLIISDDQGWTDYGFMGHPVIETPRLDRLAAQSLVFRQSYVAAPLCCPSLASIITGLPPHRHGILGNEPPPADQDRERFYEAITAHPRLPALLAEHHGGLSLQTGKWWHGHYSRGGFTHGMTVKGRHGEAGLAIGRQTMQPIYDFVAEARKERKPFFIWYAPFMPHKPHTPPEALRRKYVAKGLTPKDAAYAGMVEWFDRTCGDLLDCLDREGLAENTIVAYVADNGWKQGAIAPHHDGKRSVYEGGIRTPIMLRWPARVKPASFDAPAMSTDLAPTLLAAWGIERPEAMRGVDLLELAAGRAKRDVVCGAAYEHDMAAWGDPLRTLNARWAVAEGRWKLVEHWQGGEVQGRELYDLSVDPYEKADLAPAEAARVATLSEQCNAWWKA